MNANDPKKKPVQAAPTGKPSTPGQPAQPAGKPSTPAPKPFDPKKK